MVLLALAVATALAWAVWVVWVPLLPTNLYVPLLDLGKITGYTWPSAAVYVALVLVLFGLYALGYRTIRGHGASMWVILAPGAVFCAELLWAYPATAADIFAYVADGQLLALHNANPFVVAPSAFPVDQIVPYLAFPDEPAQYGPVWVLLSGGIAALLRMNLLGEVLAYKLVAVAAHLGSALVIYRISWRLACDRRQARACAFLFLWNPLLLWEMIGNGHNDGVMMLFGLIGVWLFVAGHDLLVLPLVACGALVKVPVALMGPVLLVGMLRRGWARAIEGGLLAVVLAVLVYRPFWEGPETLTALRRTELFTASLGSVLRLGFGPWLGLESASSLARTLSLTGFAVVFAVSLVLSLRAVDASDYLHAAYFTLLAAVLLLTTWFQAWYVVWPFAIAAALPSPRRHLEVGLLSLGGLLQYFVFIYLWVMGYFPPTENLGVQLTAYLAIIAPLVVALVLNSRGLLSRAAEGSRWRSVRS